MNLVEKLVLCVVSYSVAILFVEMGFGAEHSLAGHPFFLWSERLVAVFFTMEIAARIVSNPYDEEDALCDVDWEEQRRDYYPAYHNTPEFYIDLLAVLPFWFGFFVPVSLLPAIRGMRILRLLKFYRASPTAHIVTSRLISQRKKLRLVSAFAFITVLFAGTAMHLIEGPTQPDSFGSMWGSIWWAIVTATTVGYGDMSPATVPGQAVAAMVMVCSIGIVGALISIVSSAFNYEE